MNELNGCLISAAALLWRCCFLRKAFTPQIHSSTYTVGDSAVSISELHFDHLSQQLAVTSVLHPQFNIN